ncbi:MAG TPA: OmpA family protein [Myxococcus sp.]|nr:OmpA family protein [Myxococcus sp.]
MNRTLLCLVLAAGLTGCAAKNKNTPGAPAPLASTPPPRATAVAPERPVPGPETGQQGPVALFTDPIYFELDSATLRPEFRQTLEVLADELRKQPGMRVTVSGHTCELGTTEYNLALGQRRAAVVRDYLRRLGVEAGRMSITSYGEERPLDTSLTDSALARNRRAELRFSSVGDSASR